MDSLFLSLAEVAAIIGKPVGSFRKWWKTANGFPRPHPDFKQPRWKRSDIEQWAEGGKTRKARKRQEPEIRYN